jgi:parvulin-like peptidyl-prolyl isomerase
MRTHLCASRFARLAGAALCAWLLLAGPGPAFAQETAKPVATVNGVPIRQKTLDQAVQHAIGKGNPDSPQLRETIRQQLIARELLVQEAAKQHLDKDPEVVAIAEEAKRTAMVQRYLRTTIKPGPVSEEAVKAYYEKSISGLGPREFKIRVIQLPNEVRAKDLLGQLAKGKDFAELARQWSLAPSSTRGGEIPEWVRFKSPPQEGQTYGLPLPIAQALEKMEKGKVSDPIGVAGRWWLVKVDDVRPTRVPSYEESKDSLLKMLSAQELERATSELIARLVKDAKITQ